MNEFETGLLYELRAIKSHLADIAYNGSCIAKELHEMNEYTGMHVDYSDDIHADLESIADTLAKMYTIQDERQ